MPCRGYVLRVPQSFANNNWLGFHSLLRLQSQNSVAKAEADAAERTEDMISYIARTTRTMSPGNDGSSNRRYILRIVDEQPRGPGGFFSGMGVDVMYDAQRIYPQTPQRISHKVHLRNVFEKEQYQNLLFEYECDFGDR